MTAQGFWCYGFYFVWDGDGNSAELEVAPGVRVEVWKTSSPDYSWSIGVGEAHLDKTHHSHWWPLERIIAEVEATLKILKVERGPGENAKDRTLWEHLAG
jgi:hypothetical protein